VTAQVFGGKAKSMVQRTEVEMKSLVGFNATVELESGVSLRVGRMQGKLTVHAATLNALVAGLRSVPIPAVSSVGDQLDPNSKSASFTGLGLTWDQGQWLINAEYTQRRTDTYASDTNGWYLTVGHRFGKFTPYGTVSQLKQVSSNVDNTIPKAGFPPATQAQLNFLSANVDGVVAGQRRDEKTLSAGIRWDVVRNTALKAQIDRITPNGPGMFLSVPSNFSNRVTVYSLAVDMVF